MTPSAWRDGGRGETIRWTTFDSPLGEMLIAATVKGICRLTFDDSEASLRRLLPQCDHREGRGRSAGARRRRARGHRATAGGARPADRRRRHGLPGSGVARAAQDPAGRDAQLCRDRRGHRPSEGGPRGRHARTATTTSRPDPVPPRDPQRRLARRLWRRDRPQEEAARGGRPPQSRSRSCRSPNSSLLPSLRVRLNSVEPEGGAWNRSNGWQPRSRCGGGSSIFRWSRCSSRSSSSSSPVPSRPLSRQVLPPIAGFTAT